MSKRYVQHISGQGEYWLVTDDYPNTWGVRSVRNNKLPELCLPKSEYRLCEQVEEFEDVTAHVDYCSNLAFSHRNGGRWGDEIVTDDKGYRFRKIEGLHYGPAFIIERKKACNREER